MEVAPERSEPMDVDKIEAGPEFDVLMATEVMGWHFSDETHWTGCPLDRYSYKLWLKGRGERTGYDTTREDGFHPSTDISAAWEVLRKLREKYLIVNIRLKGDHCTVDLLESSGWEKTITGHATGANNNEAKACAIAICRAALKAVQ